MENQDKYKQPVKDKLLILRTIFFALAAGQFLFMAVAYFVIADPNSINQQEADTFKYIVPIVLPGGILASAFLSRVQVKRIDRNQPLGEKLKLYQSAVIVSLAMIEGPVLFAIVTYILSFYSLFIMLALFGLVWFLLQYPSANKIAKDLGLSDEEKRMLL